MKRNFTIFFSLVLVTAWTFAAQAQVEGPTIRLESARLYFVTFEEVDEIARGQSKPPLLTLSDAPWTFDGRTVVYPDLQLLAYIDEERGLGRRVPLVISFDQYYRLRSAAQFRQMWRTSVLSYVFDTETRLREEGLLTLDVPVNLPTFLGGGTPVIRILGNQRIEMDLDSRWTEGNASTATNRASRIPNVSMRQNQEFTVTGNIGEKIEINIKQNSEAFTDLDNNLAIRYQDVFDDGREGNGILKSFEAGNVSLNLKNTRFTGYTQQHTGLFGIKTTGQLGGFHLTAIASQEKGEEETATFRAGSQGSTRTIRDLDFRRRTYYFISEQYRRDFSRRDENGYSLVPEDSVRAIQVYVSGRINVTNPARLVIARAYPDPAVYDADGVLIDGSETGEFVQGKFLYLEPDEFYVNERYGYIALNTPLQEDEMLAVYYETVNRDGQVTRHGRLDRDLPQLRLLKRQQEIPPGIQNDPSQWGTWQYEWRNVYYLGQTDIDPQNLDLRIYRIESEGEHSEVDENGTPFVQLLGLDRRGVDADSEPDRRVDIDYSLINFERGELIFPDMYPFAPQLTRASAGQLAYPDTQGEGLPNGTPELYTLSRTDINNDFSTLHQYYIQVEHRNQLSQYSLGRSNIIEGSEIVRLNGQELERGSDYIILYEVGQIRFTNEQALSPDADVTVQFQFAPFFKPVSNTLLGLQGEYQFSERSWIKGTLLYRSDKSLEQKSRIGRETGRYMMWGIDTRLEFEPDILTSFMNFISPADLGDEDPSLIVEAEVAQSVPNPNILGDGFIDDFEGSKEETDLGVRRGGWRPASPPDQHTHGQRGRLTWYNPLEQVDVRQIYPTREVTGRDQLQHVLILEFDPTEPDLRWGGIHADSTFNAPGRQSGSDDVLNRWGGLMHPLAGAYVDQTRSRFIELWVNGNLGELHFDLGVISEDVNDDGRLDTEDDRSDGFGNNLLEPEEDVGMDGLRDEDETGYDPVTNPDPHGDNFSFEGTLGGSVPVDQVDYSKINGPEANASDPDQNRRPDTEDLDYDGVLQRQNNFFKFVVNLSPDHEDTVFVAGGDRERSNWGNADSWRLYRIPLDTGLFGADPAGADPQGGGAGGQGGADSESMAGGSATSNRAFDGAVGMPRFKQIETVRFWITKVNEPVKLRIASINIVGNQWQENFEGAITDSSGFPVPVKELAKYEETFDVAVKNTYDNPGEYTTPPDAIIEYDRVTGLQTKEQSLVLTYTNLQPHHSAQAYRTLFSFQDYTLYNTLRLYIHGSDHFEGDRSPEFFIRFGSGEFDYYEYRTRVVPGWDEANHLRVVFEDLTILKSETKIAREAAATMDSTNTVTLSDGKKYPVRFREGPPGEGLMLAIAELGGDRQYRVLGSPALARVRHITVGIYNPYDNVLAGGELWLDELRVGDVRRDRGLAGRLKIDADLGDVFSLFGTVSSVGSHFRLIGGEERGSRSTVMNFSSMLNMGRMLPEGWGLSIPLRVRWQNDLRLPRLQVGSDIVLQNTEQREAQRTENTASSFSASFTKRIGSGNPFVAWTLERIRLDFTSTSGFRHSVARNDTSGTYRAKLHYNLTPRSRIQWPILSWMPLPDFISGQTFNPFPVRLELSSEINRNRQVILNRTVQSLEVGNTDETDSESIDRGERFTRYLNRYVRAIMEPFRSVRMNYNLDVSNDMKSDSTVSITSLDFGPETSFRQNLGVDYRPEISAWFRPSYNFTTSYAENRSPQLQLRGASEDARNISFYNQQDVRTNFNISRMISNINGGSSRQSSPEDAGWFRRNVADRLASVLSNFTPVNLQFRVNRNQYFLNAISRPSFRERMGLSDYFSVPFDTLGASGGVTSIQPNQESEQNRSSFNVGTGIRYLGAVLSIRPTWVSTQTRSSNLNRRQNNTTWPEMNLRWSWSPNPRNSGDFGRLFRRIELSSGFARRKGKDTDLRQQNLTVAQANAAGESAPQESGITRTTMTVLSPLFGFVFDLNAGLVLRGSFSTSDGLTRFGTNATDRKEQNRDFIVAVDYRLRPGVRIFGRRTSGDINARLQFSRNSNKTLYSRAGLDFQPDNGQNRNRFSVSTDYRFSRYVRGGLTLELTNTQNVITREKRLRRGGGLWTEFVFN
ncbi:MAG: cell surface protein SprA [Gemmatimonadetes bacterium]|nr:cell surface protein SprA [Gemmatimonadota bacterium]